jgi:eukaryotic-like serine/threonine-protein kinase
MTEDDHTAPVPTDIGPRTRVLGDRYLLEERIASGGMASVWRAHDETLARTVAVKILHEHLAADAALRERFRREAVAAAKLGHPGIVGIYDTGEEGGRTYLVMEYVEGDTLRAVMSAQERMEPEQAAAIGRQIATALAYAHERDLVHRDVKPANILISGDGVVKVADFGIAKAAQAGRDLTQTGMVLGTAAYVAPEQVRGEPVDGAADQYALGCMLYEAITGRRPFESESTMTMATRRLEEDPLPLRSLRPDVPRGLDEVVMRSLAREPHDRYPSMTAFGNALADWAAEPVGAASLVDDETTALAVDGGGARPSFLRSEGTWLASVLALVTVAATLVAVGLATGVLESEPVPSLTASDQGEEGSDSPPVNAVDLSVNDLSAFDPEGDGRENDEDLANLLDGDPSSAWRTETYDDAGFGGGLKEGVGFVVDLGETHTLDEVLLTTTLPGANMDIRVADSYSEDAGDWEVVASLEDIGDTVRADLGGAEGRYVLVYIVADLVPVDGERAAASVSGIEIRALQP